MWPRLAFAMTTSSSSLRWSVRLGGRVRADGGAAIDLWSALANIAWHGPEGECVSYSFRAAGDLVAWVREEGRYIDWYCSGPWGVVAPWIEEGLAAEKWSWTKVE